MTEENYLKNKEKILARNKLYYIKNKEKISKQQKERRKENEDIYKIYRENYYKCNKEDISLKNKLLYKNNPELFFKRAIKRNYNISLNDYNNLLENQKEVCAICGNKETRKTQKRLSVDHDHITGKVRGLLCYNCNLGLGHFKDNPELLKKASSYLVFHDN